MRILPLLAASLVLVSCLQGATGSANASNAWRKLSAECQNLHYRLLTVLRDGQPNPDQLQPDISRISKILDELVERGELVKKEVSITFPEDDKEGDTIEGFLESIEPIAEDYGVFVAREMCDFGARLRLLTVPPKQPLRLTLRLPEAALRKFLAANRRLGILNE